MIPGFHLFWGWGCFMATTPLVQQGFIWRATGSRLFHPLLACQAAGLDTLLSMIHSYGFSWSATLSRWDKYALNWSSDKPKETQTNLIYYCQKIAIDILDNLHVSLNFIWSFDLAESSIRIPFFLEYTMSWPRSERRAKQFSPSPSSDLGEMIMAWRGAKQKEERSCPCSKIESFSSIYVYLCILWCFFVLFFLFW